MVTFSVLYHRFSRLAKGAAQKQHRKYEKWRTCGVTEDCSSQAVSDGELNMSARGCGGSSSSLPGTPGGDAGRTNSVLSWAVSFENLLQDPCGVNYFTAFLKSEVSAENILFWQACEKFKKIPGTSLDKLKTAARSIYDTYLCDSAPYSVNIDDTAKTEESHLEQPTPDMFNKAQAQIFKLMKMDSYRRFVRSPLYQQCTLASVEGKLLPQLSTEPVRIASWEDLLSRSPLNDNKNKKVDSNSLPGGRSASDKQRQKRGSWGDTSNFQGSGPGKGAQMSLKSNSSVELGSLYWQIENGRSSPRFPEQGVGGGSRIGVEGGYCCVYLPDGSASLAPTRNGQPIKDMLASLCEKRGFPLKDVIIYLHGKDKPLSLDQDCSVLRDQQVSLELRVTFALEIAFTGKTMGIMAKSSKTLHDALSVVLHKHHLKSQEALVTVVGSDEPVNMNCSVYRMANKKLRLDKAKGKDQINLSKGSVASQAGAMRTGLEAQSSVETDGTKTQPRPSKNRDMDGFLEMLTKAQCCRVDDQRGLLTKEQLEIPSFLQRPSDQDTGDLGTSCSSTIDSEVKSDDNPLTPGSAKATEESPNSTSKEVRETTV
ncbi:regulator of G-protein signaling 14 isoform 2-T3 [Menidia menidia]